MNIIILVGFLTVLVIGILLLRNYQDLCLKKYAQKQRQDMSIFVTNIEKYGKKTTNRVKYPVYYINMDKNVDRKIETIKQLSKIADKITRIPGVNGSKINNLHTDNVDGLLFRNEYMKMTKPEIGCLLAHIKAIHTAFNNGDHIAMICEDDIYTEPYKMSLSLEEIVKKAPSDWEWLQLYSGGADKSILNSVTHKNPQYLKYNHTHWSCVAYLINRSGMKKLLDTLGTPYHIRPVKIVNYREKQCQKIKNSLYTPTDNNYPCHGMADMWLPDILNSYIVIPFSFSTHPKGTSTIHEDHIETIHFPALYTFFSSLNKKLVETTNKCVYIEKDFDHNFVSDILPYYLTTNKNRASLIVDNIVSSKCSKKTKVPKIIIDREPWNDSKLANADLVITTKKYPKHNINFIYVPQYSFSFSEYRISPENLLLPKTQHEKTEFCAFVYSNCDKQKYKGVEVREFFFDLLQKMSNGRVHSWGKCKNNMKKQEELTNGSSNSSFFSPYKFVVAFENDYIDGYVSEKITNPMLAGSIPIYLGDKDIGDHFNKKSFINVRDFSSMEKCVEYILYLDSNDDAYAEMYNEPWLTDNKLTKHFSWWKPSLGDFYEKLKPTYDNE